jgi:hypothetical protein
MDEALYTVGYLTLHFVVYALVLRHLRAFTQERTIFLYHFVPALGLGAVVLGALALQPSVERLAGAVAALALQGIYSLSFLEVWSLAEGGYSLIILKHVEAAGLARVPVELEALHQVGASKRQLRTAALERTRLVQWHSDCLQLTPRGQRLALAFRAITWITNQGGGR